MYIVCTYTQVHIEIYINVLSCTSNEYTFVDLSRIFSDVYQTPIVCIYMYVRVEMNINVFSRTSDKYTFMDPCRIFSDVL